MRALFCSQAVESPHQKGGSMIDIQGLRLTHAKDLRVLVPDLDLKIHAGDKLALIGEEGNGKSTLLKYLFDPNLVADDMEASGVVQRGFSQAAYLPQSLPRESEEVSLYEYFFLEEDIDFARLYRLAADLGFSSERLVSSQTLGRLSGGEKLKVQLLKLLSTPHDIFFLDEPTNDLDLETLEWLESYIKKSKETIVFISHDPQFLSQTASRILHIEMLRKKGQAKITLANLSYDDYLKERQARLVKDRQAAMNDRREFSKKEERFRRVHDSVQHALREMHDSTQGRLLAKKMHVIKSQEKRLAKEEEGLTKVPEVEKAIDLSFERKASLAGDKVLLQWRDCPLVREGRVLIPDLTWSLRTGQKVAITGKNGIGKSSFLKLLLDDCQKKRGASGCLHSSKL